MFALAVAFLAGCATTKQAITGNEPSIRLEAAQTVRSTRGITAEVTFPAGEYRPAFRDRAGVYYRPTAEIILRGKVLPESYLFIPDDRSQPPALWIEGSLGVDQLAPRLVIPSLR